MNICLIMGGNEEGGLENHVIDLGNALVKKHEVHVIAHQKYADRFKHVSFHSLDMTRSRRNPFLLYQVLQIVRNIEPEIIHAQANKAVSIIANIKPLLQKQIKLVATLHSLKRNLRAYDKFDWVIGVSYKVLESLNNTNQSVIYNGVRLDKNRLRQRVYLTELLDLPEDTKIVVSIGRLVKVKRFDVLIETFKGIENSHLLIVGEGGERSSLEERLDGLLKKTAQQNIHLLGHRQDNIEILSAADICVISSEREGFSYVMAESLLASTPIISTNVADMEKILPQKAVVEVNNVDQLKKVLLDAVTNYDGFYKSYEPVFKWAIDKLSFDRMLNDTEQVYRDVTQ